MEVSSYLTFSNPLLLASPIILLLLWRYAARLIRLYFLRKYTTVDGLPLLGVKRDRKIQGTAVVCGGR